MKLNAKRVSLFSAVILLGFTACKDDTKKDMAEIEKIPAINLDNMDQTINPKDDFYNFVNGKWLKTATIPSDETSWGGELS